MLAVVGGAISLANRVHREVLRILKHQPGPNCKTSRELTYPPSQGTFEDDVIFPAKMEWATPVYDQAV